MQNEFFFQIEVSDEQVGLANRLVKESIEKHTITDIFANDPNGKERQQAFRFTGTLGEIIFADAYGLNRPTKSFGAIDGQDFGQDFVLEINGQAKSFDLKSMSRQNNIFRTNYVLNLPAYQMRRATVLTDCYFCISIHKKGDKYMASFLGYVSKNDIETGLIGILYKAGTKRIKDNGEDFVFHRDTYEVDFKDISTPMLNNTIATMIGFERKKLLPSFNKM